MLLNELATSGDRKIKKINKVLKETFGFTLVSDVDSGKLNELYTKVSDDLYSLKLDLSNVQDAAYMQKVLVLEGLKILIEQKKLDEQLMGGKGGRAYEKVVNWLKIAVNDACEKGDDYDEAIYDALKAYRSSMYRFPDDVVEFDLRKETQECAGELAFTENVTESEETIKEDFANIKPTDRWFENDPADLMSYIYWRKGQLPPSRPSAYAKNWNNIVKQLSAKYPPPEGWVNPVETPEPTEQECPNCWGRKHEPSDKIEPCHTCDATGVVVEDEVEESGDRHAETDWVNTIKKDAGIESDPGYADDLSGGLSLEDPAENEPEADDYFSYNRNKRTEMKEGHIKTLRKLLEAETDQAESLIAAKSFSQELQDMVEKLGRLVNENLPAVSEQMRDAYGSDVATGFEDQVSSTLNSVMDSLRNSKQEIDNSVSTIADGGAPSNDMDEFSDEELGGGFDDAELDLDGDVDIDVDAELEMGDEFGGDDAMAGLEDEPLGRAKKESIKVLGKKIVETQQKLARIKAKARS